MARIRTIKPEFFTSEDIVSLSPLARLLFIALWCEADREGRLLWKPKTFKMRYLPADGCDIDALCDELVERGVIRLYGDGLACIPAFSEHQHVNPREAASKIPAPDASTTRDARVSTGGNQDNNAQVGKEGKGKEHSSSSVPADAAALFDSFWQAYPRKVGKDAALKAFAKRKPDDALLTSMLNALQKQKTSDQWQREGGQFIPHPSTWLNEGRWQDDTNVVQFPNDKTGTYADVGKFV